MSCERARELMIDALVEPHVASHGEELREHLATCDSCRAEAEALLRTWQNLETVAVPARSPDGESRLDAAVRDEFGTGITTEVAAMPATLSPLIRVAASLMLLGVGILLGASLMNFLQDEPGEPAAVDERNRYLLIMTETREPPEQIAEAQAAFDGWIDDLVSQGIMETGMGLADGPPGGIPPSGALMVEDVSGFIVIRAADAEEAIRIAVSSPVIRYGGRIEVRAISGNDEGE